MCVCVCGINILIRICLYLAHRPCEFILCNLFVRLFISRLYGLCFMFYHAVGRNLKFMIGLTVHPR